MIQIKYTSLFEIDFLHDYYTDKKCKDIRVIPSPACIDLLRQSGLRFLTSETGCKVFAKVNESGGKDFIKSPIPENTRFSFLLLLQNSSFETFSLLNLKKGEGQHYYFNNLVSNISAGNIPNLVTDAASKQVSDADLIRFERNTYSFNQNNNAAERTGEIRFTDTGERITRDFENYKNVFRFSFNLQETSGGRASFFIDDLNVDRFYVMDNGSRQDVFGVVEIFYRTALPAAYQFLNNDHSVSNKKYRISFANRQTTWRFKVKNKFNPLVTDIKIKKANGGAIDFTNQAAGTAGEFVLTSNAPVPLKQESVKAIRMTDQNDKEIIAHLPNPSLQLLKEEGNKLFSDIYITI